MTSTTPARTLSVQLLAICLGYFMVILDVTIVTVALPDIATTLHTDVSGLQWVVDGYTLVFASLLLFCGGLGDRLGTRTTFIAGLVLFTVSSACCGAAPTIATLIIARFAQGVGAALLLPASLSLIRTTYQDQAQQARAFGVWGMVSGIAAGAGPVVGGLLVAGIGWRSIFLLNIPIGILAIALTNRTIRATKPKCKKSTMDIPAQSAAMVALAGIIGALNEAGVLGWAHPIVLGCLGGSLCAFITFIRLEMSSPSPMVPLSLFRNRTFAASAAIGILLNAGFYGMLFIAPLYFGQLMGYTATQTGLALLPAVGIVAVASLLAGQVTARTGPRFPMVLGLLIAAIGLLGWLLAGRDTPYIVLVLPMLCAGFGTACTMPAATAAIMGTAQRRYSATAGAVFNAARQLGSAIGVALFGSLASGQLTNGLHIGALICAVGLIVAAFLAKTSIQGKTPAQPHGESTNPTRS